MPTQLSRRAAIQRLAGSIAGLLGASQLEACAQGVRADLTGLPVRTPQELTRAIAAARPGDTILMQNGRWLDVQIRLHGQGTLELPITLAAQTVGQVILTGASSLQVKGRHLTVRGLVFSDGSAPDSEVISLGDHRTQDESEYCSISECAILGFNPPQRGKGGIWIRLSGRHHRIDHCHFEGKTDPGPTMAVMLDNMRSYNNQHLIEFNYFGARPELGENGGETIRIGTGAFSTQISATRIENNLFESCDGEVEIISIKSWRNVVRGNVFLRCKGTVTFRQGQQNFCEGNVFLGLGVAGTGGVRLISVDQTVKNNVLVGLRGTGFFSALSFMNGTLGRTVGTYAPVVRGRVERNTFLDVTAITLGLGASAELTQPAAESLFQRNLIMDCPKNLFVQLSAIDGIAFSDNVIVGAAKAPISSGFEVRQAPPPAGVDAWGLPTLGTVAEVGSSLLRVPLDRAAVGPRWSRQGRT